MTMIRPTASPITSATRIPIVQRARLFTAAILAEGPAENPQRLIDLGFADHEWGQKPQDFIADRVDDQALGQEARRGVLGVHTLEPGTHQQAASTAFDDRVDVCEPLAQPAPDLPPPPQQLGIVEHSERRE